MSRFQAFALPLAVVTAALVIAAALLIGGRYSYHTTHPSVIWRGDRITGEVVLCYYGSQDRQGCAPVRSPPSR